MWTFYRPEDPDGYCQLLEGKVAELREWAQAFRSVGSRLVAEQRHRTARAEIRQMTTAQYGRLPAHRRNQIQQGLGLPLEGWSTPASDAMSRRPVRDLR